MTTDSAGVDRSRVLPGGMEDRLMGWLHRLAGLMLMIACAAGWITLLSWSASDPSLSHATGMSPRNWLGPIGAIVSDLALQTLGLTAIFAYLAPVVWGTQLVQSEQVPNLKFKLLLYPLSMLALAGALSALPLIRSWPLNHGYGGIIGDLLLSMATSLLSMINPQRAYIAAGMMFFAGGFAALFASLGLTQKELQMLWQRRETKSLRAGIGIGYATTRSAVLSAVAGVGSRASKAGLFAAISSWFSQGGLRRQPDLAAEGSDPGFCPADAQFSGDGWGQGQSGGWSKGAALGNLPGDYQPKLDFGGMRRDAGEGLSRSDDLDPGLRGDGDDDVRQAPEHSRAAGFAEMTERQSHEIAQRFAPEGAVRKSAKKARKARNNSDRGLRHKGAPAADTGGDGKSSGATAEGRPGGGFLQGLRSIRHAAGGAYRRPSLKMLKRAGVARPGPEFTKTVLRGNARLLEDTLSDFGIKGEIKDIKPGPVVTLFELEPARGTKSSRVISLADDIARSMSATSVRVAVVPGRNVLGIELPNIRRETVLLRELLEAEAYRSSAASLPLALGKSIAGEPVIADLARMPHLLVAGTTGSGKSVGVNAMILSLLYAKTPEQCRFLMIDPKMLELSVYNGIAHLLCPVVTDPQKAVNALGWVVGEMEERYKRMSQLAVRNIDVFNNRVRNAAKRGETLARCVHTGFDSHSGEAIYESEQFDLEPMPHIVVVVDEFADLMVVARKEIEVHVQRLAQMARAAGIHMIMATQRPSVDIVTGTIKANFPTRISFKVTSKIDSRTILNEQGAEQLLGHGDMLFSSGMGQVARVHGPLVLDEEVEQIASFLRQQGAPDYIEGIAEPAAGGTADAVSGEAARSSARAANSDELYERAVAVALRDQKISISYLQRRLSIGYNCAADLIERMEDAGLISAAGPGGKRQILLDGESES